MRIDFSRMITAELRRAHVARQQALDALSRAQSVLADSDWMVIRASEGGAPVPESIRTARATARSQISDLRAELARLPEIDERGT